MCKTKQCKKCNNDLEISADNFYRDQNSKDGFRNKCKDCEKKEKKQYYQENIDKRREYIEANKEKIRQKTKKYKSEHKDLQKKYNKKKFGGKSELRRKYNNIHNYIRRHKHKQGFCTICNLSGKRIELANISGVYNKDIDNYMWLCCECHQLFDKIKGTSDVSRSEVEK